MNLCGVCMCLVQSSESRFGEDEGVMEKASTVGC